MFDKLVEILAEWTGMKAEDITRDTKFIDDMELDSIGFINMWFECEDAFNIEEEIPYSVLMGFQTVGSFIDYLENQNTWTSREQPHMPGR